MNKFFKFIKRSIKEFLIPFLYKKRICEISSVRNYCEKNKIEIKVLKHAEESFVYSPPIYNFKVGELKSVVSPEVYVAKMSKVIVTGGNDYLVANNLWLNDKIDWSTRSLYDFEIGNTKSIDFEKSKVSILLNRVIHNIPCGINMFGEASLNYYHWMIDILGRIVYINQFEELRDVPLLIDEFSLKYDTFKEALDVFDRYHHPIISISYNKSYCVDDLFYFSPCTFAGIIESKNATTADKTNPLRFYKDANSIKYYRDVGLEYASGSGAYLGDKIIISRNNVSQRLVNEKEIVEVAVKHGFTIYDPIKYSLRDQISIINKAKIVIGDSGAAFTNSIFGSSSTVFAVILPKEWHHHCIFSTIAYLAGCKCIYLSARLLECEEQKKGSHYYNSHYLDIEYFEDFLKNGHID